MRRFAITLIAVALAFTAAAQALAPTETWTGGYGMGGTVAITDLGGGQWEYAYDIYSKGHATYWYTPVGFRMVFEFGDGGSILDHITNLYDPGTGLVHREVWTVNGITGNHGGRGWYGEPPAGPQPSYGDLDADVWIVQPTQEQADTEGWTLDPIYSAAEGFANPYHLPSEYARHSGNPLYEDLGDAMASFGSGIPGDHDGDGKADDLQYADYYPYWGHMFDAYGNFGLLATIRIVSDLGPYGEVNFGYFASGTSGMGPLLGPGVAPARLGSFDGDMDVDEIDIDLLADAIRTGSINYALFDISGDGETNVPDGAIDINDLDYLVRFLVDTTMGVGTGSEYADFNLDGLVDTTDLTRLATYFGPGTTWAEGNANRNIDLMIDTTDLTILGTYFGFDASADAIPEPATMSLLVLGGLAVLRRRKK